MSCSYADGLSAYENKGICREDEIFDEPASLDKKVSELAQMIKEAKHVVVHTGAGISTAAGIPDFRGPKGVWTLEKKGLKPTASISFNDAIPTKSHMILISLVRSGYVHFLISQNIDGLHVRSNFPPDKLAELHGNMFLDKCDKCERVFIRNSATQTVGQKLTGKSCPLPKENGRKCRGKLHDTILDWEDELPTKDLELAEINSRKADLSICLGTTLQIVPSGTLPLLAKKNGGKLVICNLQPTKHDKRADLLIHAYIDEVLTKLANLLDVEILEYKVSNDPTKSTSDEFQEYISDASIKEENNGIKANKRKKEHNEIKREKNNGIKRRKRNKEELYDEGKQNTCKHEEIGTILAKDKNSVKEEAVKEAKEENQNEMKEENKNDMKEMENQVEMQEENMNETKEENNNGIKEVENQVEMQEENKNSIKEVENQVEMQEENQSETKEENKNGMIEVENQNETKGNENQDVMREVNQDEIKEVENPYVMREENQDEIKEVENQNEIKENQDEIKAEENLEKIKEKDLEIKVKDSEIEKEHSEEPC